MFTEPAIEIDIYTYLRQQPKFIRYDQLEDLYVLIPGLRRAVTLPIKCHIQYHGNRMMFRCNYCNRQLQKLYVLPNRYDFQRNQWIIACRSCHGLKYSSQYRKDRVSRRDVAQYKVNRLESQKRRYWYGDRRTQFGERYQKLREETKTFWEVLAEIEREAPELLYRFRSQRSV